MALMRDLDDNTLLRQYVDHRSDDAFAALVARHVNKIYSIALRHTRNPCHAQEIAHAVFVILARQAPRLGSRVILSGWLCRTAQLTAVTFIRAEIRRARREHEASMEHLTPQPEPDLWPQIAPLLDAAMAGLNQIDHHALVLRFFDGKSMREIGAALGASEDAAKMRVNRAVEKLRQFFARRGIVVPAAVLIAAISANSVQAAPATLAKTATAVALAKGATAATPTLTLIQEILKIMTWTKTKMAIAAGIVALLATGTTTIVVKQISHRRLNPVAAPNPGAPQVFSDTGDPGPPHALALDGPGPDAEHRLPNPNPNARFANLTPQQRVEQARQHFPQSIDDLKIKK